MKILLFLFLVKSSFCLPLERQLELLLGALAYPLTGKLNRVLPPKSEADGLKKAEAFVAEIQGLKSTPDHFVTSFCQGFNALLPYFKHDPAYTFDRVEKALDERSSVELSLLNQALGDKLPFHWRLKGRILGRLARSGLPFIEIEGLPKMLESTEENPELLLVRGEWYLQHGQHRQAIESLERLPDKMNQPAWRLASLQYYFDTGDPNPCKEHILWLEEKTPGLPTGHFWIRYHFLRGEFEEVRFRARNSPKLEGSALEALVLSHVALGEVEQAQTLVAQHHLDLKLPLSPRTEEEKQIYALQILSFFPPSARKALENQIQAKLPVDLADKLAKSGRFSGEILAFLNRLIKEGQSLIKEGQK